MKRSEHYMDYAKDGWQDKYVVKQYGSIGACWFICSTRWHSVRPMKRISPCFSSRAEALKWIETRWKANVEKKVERILLG